MGYLLSGSSFKRSEFVLFPEVLNFRDFVFYKTFNMTPTGEQPNKTPEEDVSMIMGGKSAMSAGAWQQNAFDFRQPPTAGFVIDFAYFMLPT